MSRFLLSSVAIVAMTATAFAADLPSRTAPASPVFAPTLPAFTWTGFYVGANAGYSWGKFTGTGGNLFRDADGFVGGAQLGYNVQLDQFVVGLETDIQGVDFRARPTVAGAGVVGANARAQVDYFGTVRARFGFALDRALVYGTGGYAYGRAKVAVPGVGSDSNIHHGWALGAGVEYAFTDNLTTRVEYLYTDLQNKTFRLPGVTTRAGAEFSTVRAGVNFKF
ncbi:outer membrane protein [Salinarimonas sp.]|uniref:outer membrane protein n=1 Tax=Salinarimonas sp. TaxID=2766526 RepID=UPI00391BB656